MISSFIKKRFLKLLILFKNYLFLIVKIGFWKN